MLKDNAYIKKLSNGRTIIKDTGKSVLDIDQYDFNCGGFALAPDLGWYHPYSDWDDDDMREECGIDDLDTTDDEAYYDFCTHLGRFYMDYMLWDFANIREIQDEDELREGERLVLFRASAWDFHYIRKLSDGTYAHKMGSQRIEEISREDAYASIWCENRCDDRYSGKIFMIAVDGATAFQN